MTAADDLRALSAAATPGPWWAMRGVMFDDQTNAVGNATTIDNAELVVWCRNHADALADLIDAASALAEPAGWWRGVEQRQEHQLLDRRAVVRDALAALEADQ